MIMYWILFRRETDNVHYLWNGEWPICITPKEDGYEPWLQGEHGLNLPDNQVEFLNDVTMTKGKRSFSIKRGPWDAKHKYIIVARGQFTKE